jgi:sugar lactone lactonase YvrE
MTDWQTLGKQHYALGESPFWHPHEQRLYWVDIKDKQILRTEPGAPIAGAVQAWAMPSEPGCIAPAQNGGLIIALRHGVFRTRQWGGALEHVVTLPYDSATVRANDGKCDALGRFWVGTIDEPKASNAAKLYSIDCREGRSPVVVQQASDALTGNGLAWSPDQRTLYWADTPRHVVHAWDFDVHNNTLTQHRHFQNLPAKPGDWNFEQTRYQGRPDGAAVDVQGNYYAAMFEGRRICQFAPSGALLKEIPTPAQCPTMPCLGGADLKTLYLTTARHGRSSQELAAFPQSGCVFESRVGVPGLPVNFFQE